MALDENGDPVELLQEVEHVRPQDSTGYRSAANRARVTVRNKRRRSRR